jgi:uncharacterized protein YjiS (DUF1127 family)
MNISIGTDRGARGRLSHVLTYWWRQLRSRHELEGLDDTLLRDIGLTRSEQRSKASFLMT